MIEYINPYTSLTAWKNFEDHYTYSWYELQEEGWRQSWCNHCNKYLRQYNALLSSKQYGFIMATLQERFDAISGKLDEASAEILAEIQKLRDGGNLTPEQEASLEAIEANGGDIVQPIGADAPEITARFRDPGGNVIGLYQQPKAGG